MTSLHHPTRVMTPLQLWGLCLVGGAHRLEREVVQTPSPRTTGEQIVWGREDRVKTVWNHVLVCTVLFMHLLGSLLLSHPTIVIFFEGVGGGIRL